MILACNDLHLDAKTPASRTDNYEEELRGLLNQILSLVQTFNTPANRGRITDWSAIEAVVIAGDLFEGPTVPFETLAWLYRWCQHVRLAGARVLAIPGNHDLFHNRLESLPKTALGLLFEIGVVENVSGEAVILPSGATVIGVPFPTAMTWAGWEACRSADIVLGHCFADREPGDYWGETIHGYAQLATLPFQTFIFGHDHRDLGIEVVAGKTFINLPALTRDALTDDVLTRDVKVALVSTACLPHAVRQVKLQCRPATEIFDLTARAEQRQEHAEIDAFVERLRADLQTTTGSLDARVEGLSLPVVVRERVLKYLSDAEAIR